MSYKYGILTSDINEGYYYGFVVDKSKDLKEVALSKAKEYINFIHYQIDAHEQEPEQYNNMINDTHAEVYFLSDDYVEKHKNELRDFIRLSPSEKNFLTSSEEVISLDQSFPGDRFEAEETGEYFYFRPSDLEFEEKEVSSFKM